METGFFAPSSDRKFIYQSTLVIEKDITKRLFAFVEYVGNFPSDDGNNQFINSGTGYLIDDRQQIDFHVGFGLDRNAPSYFFGLGYSFRIDGVLQQRDRASTRPLEATPRLNLVTK